MSFENSAGLSVRNHYGPRTIAEGEILGGQDSTSGLHKRASWVFDYNNLPANSASGGEMEQTVPKGATILSAQIEVLTAMAGTSGTLTLGLEENDGTVIDVDGIDAAVAQAALIANAVIECDGNLIGTRLAEDGQLLASTGGTVTAGRFKVVIEYRQGDADASGTYVAGGVKRN
jgi:hypothetical protein